MIAGQSPVLSYFSFGTAGSLANVAPPFLLHPSTVLIRYACTGLRFASKRPLFDCPGVARPGLPSTLLWKLRGRKARAPEVPLLSPDPSPTPNCPFMKRIINYFGVAAMSMPLSPNRANATKQK